MGTNTNVDAEKGRKKLLYSIFLNIAAIIFTFFNEVNIGGLITYLLADLLLYKGFRLGQIFYYAALVVYIGIIGFAFRGETADILHFMTMFISIIVVVVVFSSDKNVKEYLKSVRKSE